MKTVLVTGGTVRLGRAIADRLRADGWRVLTSSHRTDAGADFVADLSSPSGADELFDAVLARLNGHCPDAIVNNAGLFVGDAKRLGAVNLDAPMLLTRRMATRKAGVGCIVNILDASAARVDSRASVGYRESKEALRAWTVSSAIKFAASLRVNAVAPGAVLAPSEVHEKAAKALLVRRPSPEDVANAVAYLLSAESVTGVIIPVDAGQHLVQTQTKADATFLSHER